ncbi:MAG: esterase-like activity of phytase family protein [Pseudomonadota bacterium]
MGTHSLTADHPAFGGLSGIEIEDGALYAVTDQGWWLEADLSHGSVGIVPVNASLTPLLDTDGRGLDKNGGDAEGLAITAQGAAISFERDHRVMWRQDDGRLANSVTHRALERLRSNSGLEALAKLPDGRLVAIAEASRSGVHPMFAIEVDGTVRSGAFPTYRPYAITGADMGPDGWFYVVLRHYTALTGVAVQIHRFLLDDAGLPVAESRDVVASFEGRGGIDNMEGIAVWQDATGRTRLAVVSDDNFRFIQRTLLMDLVVLD